MIDIYSTFLDYKIKKKHGKRYFIGESIIPFNKYKIDKSDLIAKNHWDDRENAYKKAIIINELRKKIIPEISRELNHIHKINFSSSSWNLILGNWFNQFSGVIIDRYLSIENILKTKNNYNFYAVKNSKIQDLIPNDTRDASYKFSENDLWNNLFFIFLIKEIIKIKKIKNIKIKSFKIEESPKFTLKKKQLFSHYTLLFKNITKLILKLFLKINFSNKKQKIVLLNPSISFLKILELKIRLRSSLNLEPKFPVLGSYFYKPNLRHWKINEEKQDTVEVKLIKRLIPLFIPKSFIEGFPKIMAELSKNKLRTNVDIIFTSSCHYTGFDVEKIWIASQREKGSKLIVGQHGGSLHKFNINTDFEREIADKVLIHGQELFNHEKAENIGQFWHRIKKNKYNKRGVGLLINFAVPRYAMEPRCMPISSQMCKYFEDQYIFYEKLLPKIKKEFKIRLYTKGDYKWKQEERWLKRFPKVNIDKGEWSLARAISNSRLVITNYNGSTYQETLSANIPTIIYWDINLSEIPFLAENDFNNLERVGIFHRNPLSAAKFINKNWDDLNNWWQSKNVQYYRKEFCKKYCDRDTNIIKNLSNSLNI